MLEEILDFIHNYFVKKVYSGSYEITSSTIFLPFLLEGQYFRIVGSVFNDGIYQYPNYELTDEVFDGEIWAMAVPQAVLKLVGEIEDWQNQYGEIVNSPYSSESFGGYSYTKSSGGNGWGNNSIDSGTTWQSVFRKRLNKWRKLI